MTELLEVRKGEYHDSIVLLQASQALREMPGVSVAVVAMATPPNLATLAELGFDADAAPEDLVVAVRSEGDEPVARALAILAGVLGRAGPGAVRQPSAAAPPPRTTRHALRCAGDVDLCLVSVPGEHAFVEAMDAVAAGRDVMVFSDNVPVEQELALKVEADRRGCLVMGPDCGTVMLDGVGFGFANVVEPGPVGVVGASGTGIQQLACLLDEAGVGVRAAIGTGGRDLSDTIGARSTLRALDRLDRDPGTQLIVVVSKPPGPAAAADVRRATAALSTPTLLALLGPGVTIEQAAADALSRLGRPVPDWPSWPGAPLRPRAPGIRGLFCGGSSCDEAAALLPDAVVVDFGDDELTLGRPHPIIDPAPRLAALSAHVADPGVGVVLLDVVLGHGAPEDPAAGLAPDVGAAVGTGVAVIVSLIGARADPQGRDRQAEALAAAGAWVFLSNAAAARCAASAVA